MEGGTGVVRKGHYSYIPEYDNPRRVKRLKKLFEDPLKDVYDDVWRLATLVYAWILELPHYTGRDRPEGHDVVYEMFNSIKDVLNILKALPFRKLVAIEVAKQILKIMRDLREGEKEGSRGRGSHELRRLKERLRRALRGVLKDVLRKVRYANALKTITESLEASESCKGKGSEVAELAFSEEVDEGRLRLAEELSIKLRAVGRLIERRLVSLRRLGPGYEPAHVGYVRDMKYYPRFTPLARGLYATKSGKAILNITGLPAILTYAVGSKGSERIRSLGLVIDASGSMGGDEIVWATAIAIAMIKYFKPRKVRLAFFNINLKEVEPGAMSVIDALLKIKPKGGTDVKAAYEAVRKSWGNDVDKTYIITDGRDNPFTPKDAEIIVITKDGWEGWGWKGYGKNVHYIEQVITH